MTDPKISFSKEIAFTIGLEEAILLEFLKNSKTDINPITLEQITNELNFWNREKIIELLESLIKIGLVSKAIHKDSISFTYNNLKQKTESNKENKWI